MKKNIVERLIILERGPFSRIASLLLNIMGLEIPREVKFPSDWGGYILITNHQEPFSILRLKLVEGYEYSKVLPSGNNVLGTVLKKKEDVWLKRMQYCVLDARYYSEKKNLLLVKELL